MDATAPVTANTDPYYLKDVRKFLTWRPLFLAFAGTLKAQVHLLGTAGAIPADTAANRQARKDWTKGHEQAILILIKYVPSLQYVMVRAMQANIDLVNGPTSAERWGALMAHCVNVDSTYINGLREKLETVNHNAKDKVDVTIAKLAAVVNECRESGEASLVHTDHDIAARLLRIVGRNCDWSAVTETISACETVANPLTLNTVETRLKNLQAQRDDRKAAKATNTGAGGDDRDSTSTVHALMVKIESLEKKLKGRPADRDGPIRCFNCGEEGHKSGECKKPCGRKLQDETKCGGTDHTSATCTNPNRRTRK